MREPRISAALRKDREIREARLGFGLVAWLFGIWAFIRLPYLLVFFFEGIGPIDKVLNFLLTIFVIGVTVVAIKRYLDLGRLRKKFSKAPEKYQNVKIEGSPVLTTIIPFLLK